ncbi:DUF2177 family protein [Candidatus Woesebacteria bacterium]|jgi:uncharacterized membrane protein|nr:DUF2177 family protein [Candidatus Woesebacteria bacterium]MBP6882959.1 DUF2177 family protein [Candidatus Woesebacteria bacterium]
MFIKMYLVTLFVFFAIDMVWLGLIAKTFYQSQIGYLMKATPNWTAAIIFYLLFIVGLVVFVVAPSLAKQSWSQALLLGALFGLICYATYDLTNLATIKNWPILVTVVDLIWGTVLSASVSYISYNVIRFLKI